ncbi:MAG: DNRLRE domain-containing protein [Planctomycetota bacterium]
MMTIQATPRPAFLPRVLGLSVILALPFASNAAAQTIVPASEDAEVDSARPTSRLGTASTMVVSASGGRHRAYIKFDLSGISRVPFDAQLVLNLTSGAGNFDVHAATSAWAERTVSWSGQPTFGAVEASQTASGALLSFSVLDLVSGWIDGSRANEGLLVKCQDETGAANLQALSREHTFGVPPRLVLDYGFTQYGAGCGVPVNSSGSPVLGGRYQIAVDGLAPPFHQHFCILGASPAALSLGSLAPGCKLLNSADLIVPMPLQISGFPPVARASLSVNVASMPSLVGASIYHQIVRYNVTTSALTLSEGIQVTIHDVSP